MIETDRLILRKFVLGDVSDVLALSRDDSVRQFIGNLPISIEEAWRRILQYVGHWAAFGYGSLAVVEKSSGCIVGEVSAGHYARGIHIDLENLPEISWLIAKNWQGKGYAKEGVLALLDWLSAECDQHICACLIETSNNPSMNLAQKLRFNKVDEVLYRNKGHIVLLRHNRFHAGSNSFSVQL